jgi:cell division protein FtsQ
MKRLALRLLFAFVIVPGALAYSLFYLNKIGFFNVEEIILNTKAVEGQSAFVRPLEQALIADLNQYKSKSLWSMKLRPMAQKIDQLEWVKSVKITRKWPNVLVVDVLPIEIKFLVLKKSGELIPVDHDGNLLSKISISQAPDVVTMSESDSTKTEVQRKRVLEVIKQIPSDGLFSQKTVAELSYSKKSGFSAKVSGGGLKVNLGEEAITLKSTRVNKVLEYIHEKNLEAREIDANLSKKVLVKLREADLVIKE